MLSQPNAPDTTGWRGKAGVQQLLFSPGQPRPKLRLASHNLYRHPQRPGRGPRSLVRNLTGVTAHVYQGSTSCENQRSQRRGCDRWPRLCGSAAGCGLCRTRLPGDRDRRGRPQSDIAEPRRILRAGYPVGAAGGHCRRRQPLRLEGDARPPAPSGRRPTTPHSHTATRRSSACPRRSTRPATRTCASSSRPASRWRSTSIPACS